MKHGTKLSSEKLEDHNVHNFIIPNRSFHFSPSGFLPHFFYLAKYLNILNEKQKNNNCSIIPPNETNIISLEIILKFSIFP